MWFTTGIAYNVGQGERAHGGRRRSHPGTSSSSPKSCASSADCGVYVLDSPEDMFAVALRYLRLEPGLEEPRTTLRRAGGPARDPATNTVQEVQFVRLHQRARQRRHLPGSISWAGDSFQARNPRTRSGQRGRHVAYVDTERRHVDVARQHSPFSRTRRILPKPIASSTSCCGRTMPHATRRITNFANPIAASKPMIDARTSRVIRRSTPTMRR